MNAWQRTKRGCRLVLAAVTTVGLGCPQSLPSLSPNSMVITSGLDNPHGFKVGPDGHLTDSLVFAVQDPQVPRLSIVIVEGEGAINNPKQRTSRETIVEVQDENHRPVAGAAVVFLLPGDGPGGAFAGGAKSATLVTDSVGRATMPTLQPNQSTGNFKIRVNASSQGRQAAATAARRSGVLSGL